MILAIDQGTSGTTCLVVDPELRVVGRGHREIRQYFPQPGWVEHDPEELWQSVIAAATDALSDARLTPAQLEGLGLTSQRETTVVWDRRSGRPVQRAIVWQDRRTAERCLQLPRELVRERTGLVPDPYFSATKLEWLLARTDRPQTELAFGTIDSWLIWKLTRGTAHATDETNASRTMLFDLRTRDWDPDLLRLFGIDPRMLPTVKASSGMFGEAQLLGARLPIAGVAGDQQAALFGLGCFSPGEAKATYGTGSFVLVNVGSAPEPAPAGLLRTAAAVAPGCKPQDAVEGAVLVSGAALQWLRDGLGIITDASDSAEVALATSTTDGVYFVPALTGLGSPHWDPHARGLITGLTRSTTRGHIVRATLEAMAFQVADVLAALPMPVDVLRVDGGGAANPFLMQFQADILGRRIEVAAERDSTALGAAALAGLAIGMWRDSDSLRRLIRAGATYEPLMPRDEAEERIEGWKAALRLARQHDDAPRASSPVQET